MAKLTAAEIRKLIKAHNVLTKITIPKGAKRDDLIKLVEKNGYSVDHDNKKISRTVDGKTKTITLKGAEAIGKPKPLTEEQKKKRQQAKQKRAGEKAFLKKAIPAPPPVSKQSKGVKVGKPPPKTKPPKKIGAKPVPQKKSSKEDEIRPARKAAPPIPRARDFVKIGKKPEGRIDTGGSRNVGKVDNTKPKKKEKKKIVPKTEKAKKLREDILARKNEAIKAKKVKLLTREEYFKLLRKAVKDITPTEKAQMEKYQNQPAKKEDKKEAKKEENVFDSVLKQVLSEYFDNLIPNNVNDREENRLNKEVKLIEKIYESKKTSKFTKPEISVLKRAVSVAKANNIKNSKQFEDIVANLGSKKKSKKKESPKKLLGGHRMKGGLISMIMTAEGEAKTILENTLKKFNSLTDEEKEENRQALDNDLFDKVISYEKVDSSGNITGGGVKALKEVQKAINKMGSKN